MRDIATVRTYTTPSETYLRLKVVRVNLDNFATFSLATNTQILDKCSVSRADLHQVFHALADVLADWPTS